MNNNDGRTGGTPNERNKSSDGFYSYDFNADTPPPKTDDAPPNPPPRAPQNSGKPQGERPRVNPLLSIEEYQPRGNAPPKPPAAKALPPTARPPSARPPRTPPPKTQKSVPADGGARPAPQSDARTEIFHQPARKNGADGAVDVGDFRVNFDFDKEYKNPTDKFIVRRGYDRRTGLFGGILLAGFVAATGLILAFLLWFAAADVLGFEAEDSTVQVTIPRGSTIDQIADILYENELIKYRFLFKLYANLTDAHAKISPGTFILNTNYDYFAIVSRMSPRAPRVTTRVTMPEGFTLAQIFDRLELEGVATAEDLWEAATNYDFEFDFLEDAPPIGDRLRLEGFLFPDTMDYYLGESAESVIRKMLSNFNNRFSADMRETAEQMGYSVRDIIIIASLIEREAGVDADRPLIASVIYNRIADDDFPRLEIDATIIYAMWVIGQPWTIGDPIPVDLDNPYNTRLYPGMPPGPIGNPGIRSIRAALDPASTNYYYYALRVDGSHQFTRTIDEHNAFVQSEDYGG